jgi:hypothetical protein
VGCGISVLHFYLKNEKLSFLFVKIMETSRLNELQATFEFMYVYVYRIVSLAVEPEVSVGLITKPAIVIYKI